MKQLKFYGLGGQGVVTAAKVLSTAVSIHENKFAITIPAYGHERRGAPVYTDVMVDDKPIQVNCYVYEPDIVMVTDPSVMQKGIDVGAGRHDGTMLVLNTPEKRIAREFSDRFHFRRTYFADGTQIALDNIGLGIPNASMLGVLAHTGVVSIDSLVQAIKEFFGKAGEKNANAAREAYGSTRTL